MKVSLWVIGKTSEKYLLDGIKIYIKRLEHYCRFEWVEFKDVKNFAGQDDLMKKEAELVLSKLKPDDSLILLDEYGKMFDSIAFSDYIQKFQVNSTKSLVFLVGGAFGHHALIRERAVGEISLSKMTFSHQMVRLFFVEQLYRAFTILKNEKYHNS